MKSNLAQQLINQGVIPGYVGDKECQILIGKTLREEKGEGDKKGIFIDVIYLKGNGQPIPQRIDKITFYNEDQALDAKAHTLIITRAFEDGKKK
ncbi:MAG: hypothetical protein WCJ57_03295 [Candidatus Falkowbacteria bacterium]